MSVKPLNTSSLLRVETFTDGESGDITALIPVLADGQMDLSRSMRFRGRTQIAGIAPQPLVLQFELSGESLAEAMAAWEPAVEKAIEEIRSQMVKRAILTGADGRPLNGAPANN